MNCPIRIPRRKPAPRSGAIRVALIALAVIAFGASSAQAQWARYTYPRGYADWGWGGWGQAGAATGQGDMARGLGALAQQAGSAAQQNAEASAINADTVRQWNEYVYQAQLNSSRRYQEKLARDRRNKNKSREQIYKRLRDDPTETDIARGDALNVALDEINNPKIFRRALSLATAPIDGAMIRDIPFQYAAEAITTSVVQVVRGGPPASLKRPQFDPERTALREVAARIRAQNEGTGGPDPNDLERARTLLKALMVKVEANYTRNSADRRDAEKWIKAAYGLTRMLETPAINVLLAGVEKRPDTTLADLLLFMDAFNLRFGAAKNDRQKAVYEKLYPLLVKVRGQLKVGGQVSEPKPESESDARPGEFFNGMEMNHLESPNRPPAPQPPGTK
jgi:hypothetical protein